MKIRNTLLTAIALFLLSQAAFAQPICAFDHLHGKLLQNDEAYRKSILASETKIQEFIRKHPAGSVAAREASTQYSIPVVVHVIHTGGAIGTIYNPTDAQINGAINYLNQVYNGTYPGIQGVGDLGVQFVLASRDTNCNASSGIDRIDGSSLTNYVSNGVNSANTNGVPDLTVKNFDRWDPVNYYNIWVVNKIDGNDGTSGQFIAGYAYFAGAPASLDGTVMLATQMVSGQKTLPHEIGHALSLYHPFQGSSDVNTCPSNSNCNTDGDMVCDTDPITYNQTGGVVDFTCRTGINSCTGTAYSSNTESNFMNYTSCYTLFTAGQKTRMQAAMSLPSRQSLVNSSATGSYVVSPYVTPANMTCKPATSATGLSNYYAGVMNVSVANKSFASGASKDDGGYLDKTGKCLYLIPMQKGSTYSFATTLLAANNEQLAIWIDYNNDGVFSSAERVIYNSDIASPGGGNYAVVTNSFTIPGTAVTNTVLRMRVMDEVSTIYGFTIPAAGCYNPTYGQAEDYPIYLASLLPVQLDYFRANKNNNDALLSWKTSSEENAKEFRIEKSTDGIVFSQIGIVSAANIATGSTYSYTDKNITGPENYYRLRQVDINDKAELSQVVLVRISDDTTPALNVVTNPVTANQLDFIVTGVQSTNSIINLFDITGRKILSRNYAVTNGQVQHLDFSAAGIKAGMYILQVQNGNKTMTAKVVKQ